MSEPDQLDLFTLPDNAIKTTTVAPSPAQIARNARAQWTDCRVADPCADCIAYLHANGGIGPNPQRARRQRVVRDDQGHIVERIRVCHEHGRVREQADQQAAKAAERKANRAARR